MFSCQKEDSFEAKDDPRQGSAEILRLASKVDPEMVIKV